VITALALAARASDLALDTTLLADANGGGFGSGVAGGDFNGDGFSDVLVGQPSEHTIHLFLGSPSGLQTTALLVFEHEYEDYPWGTGYFGAPMAALDGNADGYDDVAVSAVGTGDVYLLDGGPAGLVPGSERRLEALEASAGASYFGDAIANAGDTDGDGYPELVVGDHPWQARHDSTDGAVFVYSGSQQGVDPCSELRLEAPNPAADGINIFGAWVAGAGDVNHDGYAEVASVCLQCGTEDGGWGDDPGEVYVWHGGAAGIGAEAPEVINGAGSIALVPDVDGDDYDELLIDGANGTWLLYGSAAGIDVSTVLQLSEQPGTEAGLGDVDGDGLGDMLIGHGHYGASDAWVELLLGNTSRAPPERLRLDHDPDRGDSWGIWSAYALGDIDGDGRADFASSAVGAGEVYVCRAACAWYADADGDGAGDPATWSAGCWEHPGQVANATDCDDADASVQGATWYPDADGDGWGVLAGAALACARPASTADNWLDCDDADAPVHPEAEDASTDGVDQDCDGYDGVQVRDTAVPDCTGDTGVPDTGGPREDTAPPRDSGPPAETGAPDTGAVVPPAPRRAQGCGCGTGGAGPVWVGLVALAWRRRPPPPGARGWSAAVETPR
jgi:hypothetical protein